MKKMTSLMMSLMLVAGLGVLTACQGNEAPEVEEIDTTAQPLETEMEEAAPAEGEMAAEGEMMEGEMAAEGEMMEGEMAAEGEMAEGEMAAEGEATAEPPQQ